MSSNGTLPAYRQELPVAVDAMGGDRGLSVQVEGAIKAYKEFGAKSILVGPEIEIKSLLESLGGKSLPIDIHHASETIGMGESPARAVRKKPDSSLCVAYELVKSGRACAIISSGNTGAMMAAGRILCGVISGIERPAIATVIPGVGDHRGTVILDVGANVDCHAHHLVQFAIMGSIYHSSFFGEESPRVSLLSNGTESSKGNDIIRAAATVLQELSSINYTGYVEGRDVAKNSADVIVCDGFVGNVVLKTMEGCVRLVAEQLKLEGSKGVFRKLGLGLSKGVFKDVFIKRFDYSSYGGAPLLGLPVLALVLHGSSDARAVKNGIRTANNFSAIKMIDKISAAMGQLEESSLSESVAEFPPAMFDSKKMEVKKTSSKKKNIVEKKAD